jgi:hypothetical protein
MSAATSGGVSCLASEEWFAEQSSMLRFRSRAIPRSGVCAHPLLAGVAIQISQYGTAAFYLAYPSLTNAGEPNAVRAGIDEHTDRLAEAVRFLKQDIDQHNATAPNIIRQRLDRKRQLAEATTGVVASLGIPVKRKDEPPAFAAPVKRRPSPTQRAANFTPEPFLEEKEYVHILDILRSMALVIERSPDAFATLDEEAIRTHFLL